MSSAMALSAVRRAVAFAASPSKSPAKSWKCASPATPTQGRPLVMLRAEGVAVLPGILGGVELELKEQVRQGVEQVAVALQPRGEAEAAADHCGAAAAREQEEAPCLSRKDRSASKLDACQALAEGAMCGEAQAATSLIELLRDSSHEVRDAALDALTCIAQCGPQSAVEAAASSLQQSDVGLRWRSLEHDMAADALAARMSQVAAPARPSTEVAASSVNEVVAASDQVAAPTLSEDSSAKLDACSALAEEAMCGVVQAASDVVELLQDNALEVRSAALVALSCIARCGPQSAVDAAVASLQLSDAGLRWRSEEHSMAAAAFEVRLNAPPGAH